jgi:hypothetical protein
MARAPRCCFDRILPRDLFQPPAMQPAGLRGGGPGGPGAGGPMRGIAPIGKTWMNGSTLHVRFLGGTSAQHDSARTQAGWWEAVANLHFIFDDHPQAEIRIAFDAADGAWSYIGTDARSIPLDQPTMNLGFEEGGTAAHEFGHAIGLAHEHQNPQGGIQWNEAAVLRAMAGPPNFWDEATTRHNILHRYRADQIKGTAFDPDSVMLYFFPAEWTSNGIATRANEWLSATDRAFISGAQMYPKDRPTHADALALKVNARARTTASIGRFGEEDLYVFDAPQAAAFIIDTQGRTDVVMKLFGPDQPTRLVAEDDDSGQSTNARIARRLSPGRYWVQIRHHDLGGGTGDYSVKVRMTRS